ncbi:MAG: PEP/pyruvate-binding domain-containing protein [Thermoplasmatota archaeon]
MNDKLNEISTEKEDISVLSKDKEMDELQERVKELNCFYGITKIIKDTELCAEEALQKIVEILPPSWQHEDAATARIVVNDQEFKTEDFEETKWCQTSDIAVEGKKVGKLQICYLEEKPEEDEGPFLEEERRLIDAISELLGGFIEECKIKEGMKEGKIKIKKDDLGRLIGGGEEKKMTDEKADWEVIIDLLMKTDPRTLLRMTRKMVYYLYRNENEKITALLNDVCPITPGDEIPEWCGINMPNPRQDLESLKKVQEGVFEIARESLSPQKISELFQRWLREDKARPLLLASQKKGISLVDIKDELNRFFDKPEDDRALAPEDRMAIRTALIQRFFTDRLKFINVAKKYIEVNDFLPLLENTIGPTQGAGKLGGKTSGAYLANKIINEEMEDDELLDKIDFPKSWYLTSDTMLDLIHYNDLDEVIHIKYLDPDEIRQEQPFLEQIMKNAVFTTEIIEGLKKILRNLDDKPIIVRSSSLLEDNFGAAFSGKYKSLYLPNTGTEEERLNALTDAILEVYASTFGPDPIEYRREKGMLDFSEEMGVLIQEVVGQKVGQYYMPAYAGVAFSRNEFRWSPRIRRNDGILRMVPGLGTRAVDRVGNDYPTLISPNRPDLRVNTLLEEQIKYSPKYLDAINLETGNIETVDAIDVFQKYGDDYPILDKIVSVYENDQLKEKSKFMLEPESSDMIVTFNKLFESTEFLNRMKRIMDILEERIGTPVDVEFASDGEKIYILQCRPQSQSQEIERKPVPKNIKKKRKLFSAHKYVTTSHIENIEYIVYVVPEEYTSLDSKEKMRKVARIVGELNNKLPKRKFIMMGPGRWGSRGDIKLGVPVRYNDINNTSLLVEIAREKGDYLPELSFGTHFFQDLVEAEIRYLPLYPDEEVNIYNEDLLFRSKNRLSDILPRYEEFEDVIRVINIGDISQGGTMSVVMDGEANEALAYLKRPDHWDWRMEKVHEIGEAIDPEIYNVKKMYVIGSTKDGSAGAGSDIDLLIHFDGNAEQKDKLKGWLNKWDKELCKENEKRTGLRTESMLDIHIITDEDLENETSWATHITSPYKSAREIPIHQND